MEPEQILFYLQNPEKIDTNEIFLEIPPFENLKNGNRFDDEGEGELSSKNNDIETSLEAPETSESHSKKVIKAFEEKLEKAIENIMKEQDT